MKILVTGATGFVGSAVARILADAGHSVRVLVRPSSNLQNIHGIGVEPVQGDLVDPSSLKTALKGCRGLFHVAADYRLWVPDPDEIYRANVQGTENIINAALDAQVDRICYTSSVATLGLNKDGSPADEETPVSINDMIGHYKRSKFIAEERVRQLIKEKGAPVVIVNPSTPVGPRDIKPTPTGKMVLDAASGRMPAYVNTGLNFVHVDDVAMGHLLAFERGETGRRYILGGTNLTLKEFLDIIAGITGGKPPVIKLPHNLVLPVAWVSEAWCRFTGRGEPAVTADGVKLAKKHMFFSCRRAREELGYVTRPVQDAVSHAIEWFRQDGRMTGTGNSRPS